MKSPLAPAVAFLAAVVVLVGFGVAISGFSYTDPGYIGIARNGGPFDNTQIRRTRDGAPVILEPGSSYTWIGAASTLHSYPVTARYWTIDSAGSGGGGSNQTVNVPTRDGVSVGAEGQFTFLLNTAPEVLADFDNRFGTRSFAGFADDEGGSPSDGTDAGFNAFLAAYLPPTITNALRQEIGGVNCRDLIASCALVQNDATPTAGVQTANTQGALQNIQERVSRAVEANINANLGGPFITDVKLSLSKVTLPEELQQRVTAAQGAFAAVSEAQARIQSAQADATANQTRQQGYNACPTCGQIDILRALPPGLSTYAPGQGFAVAGGR